jgi:hypothetical protein
VRFIVLALRAAALLPLDAAALFPLPLPLDAAALFPLDADLLLDAILYIILTKKNYFC